MQLADQITRQSYVTRRYGPAASLYAVKTKTKVQKDASASFSAEVIMASAITQNKKVLDFTDTKGLEIADDV